MNVTQGILPIPAVNAVIFNSEGKVLITQRSSRVREPGKWCLPGGHLDGGEFWEAGMRREVREEVGLVVLASRLVGVYSDPELTVSERVFEDGLRRQYVAACFLVTQFTGEVVYNDEVADFGWFEVDALPEVMLKSHPVRIRDALRIDEGPFAR